MRGTLPIKVGGQSAQLAENPDNHSPVAVFDGPPADRVAGRAQVRAARAQGNYGPGGPAADAKAKQKAADAKAARTASTEARANSFLAREELLDRAIASGVIQSGVREHYARAYDEDPEGCRAFLARLPGGANLAGSVVASAAADGDGLSLLTDAERERVAAARAGQRGPRFVHGG